ncbi:MarR family winged helix-turn-helix transcriptional regulator [Lacticaseibacillus nasuensis]|uniref:MarR family winged helix-turn-helix transcriptional regulator n=1 Tax=Lacticaseibacillus nasuensis TaxID=944671 RepID=UPI000AE37C05|nr:MarR family winged helix-turn-helix transcriptional regulator [Lacticaseibacillus nasuensis]
MLNEYIEVYFTAFKNVGDLVSEPMHQYHLSFEQFLIMRDVAAGHKVALSAIAEQRRVSRAAISRQIKTLLDRDYLVQERDTDDRRRQFLHLTPTGEQVTAKLNVLSASASVSGSTCSAKQTRGNCCASCGASGSRSFNGKQAKACFFLATDVPPARLGLFLSESVAYNEPRI